MARKSNADVSSEIKRFSSSHPQMGYLGKKFQKTDVAKQGHAKLPDIEDGSNKQTVKPVPQMPASVLPKHSPI